MSPQVCTVCTHPKRKQIDLALVERKGSKRAIAGQFDLSRMAVLRHSMSHLPAAIAAGGKADREVLGGHYREVLIGLIDDMQELWDRVVESKRGDEMLQTIDKFRPLLEQLGKVARELQADNAVTVQLGIVQQLGVVDLEDAKRRIERSKELEGMSDRDIVERMRKLVAQYDAEATDGRNRLP